MIRDGNKDGQHDRQTDRARACGQPMGTYAVCAAALFMVRHLFLFSAMLQDNVMEHLFCRLGEQVPTG